MIVIKHKARQVKDREKGCLDTDGHGWTTTPQQFEQNESTKNDFFDEGKKKNQR